VTVLPFTDIIAASSATARAARFAAAFALVLIVVSPVVARQATAEPATRDSATALTSVPVEIRGTVKDANGNPVRNASVRLMSDSDTLDVVTDRSGRFHGRLPMKKDVAVRVRAPGYRDMVRFVKSAARPVSLTLPPPYPMSSVTMVACVEETYAHVRRTEA
jgi:hypothetical protein